MSEDTNKSGDQATKANDETAGLKAKVNELLGTIKELKGNLTSKEQEAEDAATEAERAKGDVAALEKRLAEKHEKAIKALKDTIAERDASLKTLTQDNAILDSMSKAGVVKELQPAVEALLKSKAQYADGVTTIEGQSIADYTASFFASDAGKHFVAAPVNSGSNSTGSTVKGQAYTKENFDASKWAELSVSDPAAARAWAVDAGKQNLADSIQ